MRFADRADAGRRLGTALREQAFGDAVVLGLPRGGVPVAFEVAAALGAPLDVILVRKLGVPFQPELGMGAIGEGGVRIVNEAMVREALVTRRSSRRSSTASAPSSSVARAGSAVTGPPRRWPGAR